MRKDNKQVIEALSMVLQFGLNMIVPIFACTFLGIWIGNYFNITWLVIPFFFIGALSGFTSINKLSKRLMKDEKKEGKNHVKKD